MNGRSLGAAVLDKPRANARVRMPTQDRSRRSLERMLDAAAALIARNGIESLTVADVVRRAKSSVGAFYARFADKDALIREVQDRFVGQCEDRLSIAVASLDTPNAGIDTAVEVLIVSIAAVFREHSALINAFIRQAGRDEVLRRRVDLAFRRLTSEVGNVLARRFGTPSIAANTFVRIITATLEQYVATAEPSRWTDWDTLVGELQRAGLAYLTR
jgi:AcrR family transcriptional regulator